VFDEGMQMGGSFLQAAPFVEQAVSAWMRKGPSAEEHLLRA